MKTRMFWIMISLTGLLSILAACQKNNQDGGSAPGPGVPAGYATTPQPCNLGQPGCSSPYILNQYPYGGVPNGYPFWFGNNMNINSLNCGCPSGLVPMYNTTVQWGMACGQIPSGWNNPWSYSGNWYGSIYGGYGTYGISANQVPATYMPPNTAGICGGSTVFRYCDVRFANSCELGSSCQPFSGGSGVGMCIRAY